MLFPEISNMTNLEVVEVNVDVVDIKTKEQHEADSVSLQDRATGVKLNQQVNLASDNGLKAQKRD